MGHAFLQSITERLATTFELLPERVDLLSLVVEMATVFTVLGTGILLLSDRRAGRQPRTVRRVERLAILGAFVAVAGFFSVYIAHKVG
jgi:hypothetical protein